ncbi:restriction endonuclease subunit S [Vibrio cholerae]|nr:restriction endonuclease subunit S [Vibrio cholerae]
MSKQKRKVVKPNLRFKRDDGLDFPLWSVKPLKEIAVRITKKNSAGDVVRVLTNSASGGVVDQRDYFEKDIANKNNLSGYFIVDKGAYVYNPRISSLAPVGPISKNKIGKGVMSPLYTVFKFYDSDDSFFEYFFKSNYWHSYMRQVSNSGARHDRMSITNDDFMNMPMPYPEKDERDKIADCLLSIDELIATEGEKLDELKAHKKGLMQQLFPAEGETVPKKRFPEFERSKSWKIQTISQLINEGLIFPPKDGNHGNIHPKSSDYVSYGIPFLMASDIKNGVVSFETCSYIRKQQADSLQKGFAREGDVLLTHKGTVGEVALVKENEFPYLMLTPQVTYYRVKNREKLSNKFLAVYFNSECFQKELQILSGGGTRSYIGITKQQKLKVAFPNTLMEQEKVANCLFSIDEVINKQMLKLNQLAFQKMGLLQNLFPSIEEVVL